MANLKIDQLSPTNLNLSQNLESFFNELADHEIQFIKGGQNPVPAFVPAFVPAQARPPVPAFVPAPAPAQAAPPVPAFVPAPAPAPASAFVPQ